MTQQPGRRDRTRPMELVILAAVIAGFTGLVVLMSTRDGGLAAIFFGIGFIVTLVVFAMLALASAPNAERPPRGDGSPH